MYILYTCVYGYVKCMYICTYFIVAVFSFLFSPSFFFFVALVTRLMTIILDESLRKENDPDE